MELFLNLAWVLLSLVLLAGLRSAPTGMRRAGRAADLWHRFAAVFLLSFLLLPVISMTDDLHAATTMAEGERAYRKATFSNYGHLKCPSPVHPAASVPKIIPVRASIRYGVVALPIPPIPQSAQSTYLRPDRAPPESQSR